MAQELLDFIKREHDSGQVYIPEYAEYLDDKPHVLVCGYYLPSYTRYEANMVALAEIYAVTNRGITYTTSWFGKIKYALRMVGEARSYDVVYIHPYNYVLPIAFGLTKPYHRATVVFDIFQSAVLATWSHTHSRLSTFKAWVFSFLCVHLADILLCLGGEYREYYHRSLLVRRSKLPIVRDGVGEAWAERPQKKATPDSITRVIYWGQFLPHHNLAMVISTARALQLRKDIKFILCGDGLGKRDIVELAEGLGNVEFRGWFSIEELVDLVDSCDIVLGSMLNISDSFLSAANKQIEGMYRGKPVITIWSQQKKDLYGEKCLILTHNPSSVPCPPSEELRYHILNLADNPWYASLVGMRAKGIVGTIHNQEIVNSAIREALVKQV